jgi:hypothetical protein
LAGTLKPPRAKAGEAVNPVGLTATSIELSSKIERGILMYTTKKVAAGRKTGILLLSIILAFAMIIPQAAAAISPEETAQSETEMGISGGGGIS